MGKKRKERKDCTLFLAHALKSSWLWFQECLAKMAKVHRSSSGLPLNIAMKTVIIYSCSWCGGLIWELRGRKMPKDTSLSVVVSHHSLLCKAATNKWSYSKCFNTFVPRLPLGSSLLFWIFAGVTLKSKPEYKLLQRFGKLAAQSVTINGPYGPGVINC